MDTPNEMAAFADGKDYVVHGVQEWINKHRKGPKQDCAVWRALNNLLTELESELKTLQDGK